MLYQRRIADNQIVSAKLELHLRGSRYAGVGAQLLGIVSLGLAGFYSLNNEVMLTWAISLLVINLWWSRRVNRTLETSRHFTQRPAVFNELLLYAAVSGAIWGGTVIWLDGYLSDLIFYLCVGVVAIISVVTIAVSVVIRQAYLTQLVFSLGTIALWLAWHAEARPFNAGFAILLVGLSVFLVIASEWMSGAFSEMVETSLERAAMSKDLASLTDSLKTRNLQLQDARRQLAEQATIDEMTGLRNRRGVNIIINDELARMKRMQLPIAVIALDVDHFKTYNDNYGHPAGDQVLQRLANVMLEMTSRAGEFAARMGGEEFVLFYPTVNRMAALELAEELRMKVLGLKIPHEKSLTAEYVTVSIGVVSCVPEWELEFDALLKVADDALYLSKTGGRNRVTCGELEDETHS
jgi:diguanylate cyclase (GGDEF)-like protein